MKAIATRIGAATGFRRLAVAFLAGATGALAMAPLDLLPALAVSLTLAVWLLDGIAAAHPARTRRWRAAALAGWAFGFGAFTAGLWWLGSAFLVEPDQFALLMPLGVLGLPAGLGLFTALGFALASLLWSRGATRILALVVGLGGAEILRGNILTGFPWNSTGMALGGHLWLAQAASLVGLNGLTLIAIALCAAPATLADVGPWRRRWLAPGLSLGMLATLAAFGLARLSAAGDTPSVPGVTLRIMQPNLPQDAKFRPENGPEIMARYLRLSRTEPGRERVTHYVWPESAFPFVLAYEPVALREIAALLDRRAVLLTGAVRATRPLPGEQGPHFFNSIQVVGSDGSILASADKLHLVPFGEYLPFSDLLTRLGLRQFVHAPGGFEAGTRREALRAPGLPPLAPLICYEAIFPGEVRPDAAVGAMVNVTNDAWFGITPGPYQHFAQARLRTIEEGLPLIRAANTGISAVVDPYGRLVAQLPLGVEGALDSTLPQAIAPPPVSRLGHWVWFALLSVNLLFTVSALRKV